MSHGNNRRDFLKTASGLGAAALAGAPAVLAQRGANDRLGIAMVGVGTRGHLLQREFQECPNTEIRIICDIYDGNLKRGADLATNKNVVLMKEWEKAVASPDIDAVVIATPDFWHAPMTVLAAENKKHVYCEKGLCRNLGEAKAIRKSITDNKVMFQLGHHQNSDPWYIKAREIYESGKLGKVPLVRTYIDRTSAYPEWTFYTDYNIQKPPADAGPATIEWNRFLANAATKDRPFDLERFFKWRCYWEYGTGIAGDLMSHQWDSVNSIVRMGIPESVQTMGGLYFWKEDRDVPDQWHVLFDYPKQNLAVTFTSAFHNRHEGTTTFVLGRDATLEVGVAEPYDWYTRLYDAEWKPEVMDKASRARRAAATAGQDPRMVRVDPIYSYKPGELKVTTHMRNFIDSIRGLDKPRCGLDRAWQEGVTICMAVESYFKERKVKWDPVTEQIV